ncbi:MAG: sensor histidine kinase [Gemmatimonadota bacterium]
MITPIDRIRWRITFWYVTVYIAIMALFGAAIYTIVTREMGKGIDRSLERTVDIRTRWVLERTRPRSVAFAEDSTIPLERAVVVFSATKKKGCASCPQFWAIEPISPSAAPSYIQKFALNVLNDSIPKQRVRTSDDRSLLLYGKKVVAQSGRTYATVAIADIVELESRYPSTFTGLILSAIVAILLVGIGGAVLARQVTEPIETAFNQMRRFMGDAAHELKTPIAVLRARTDVALQRVRTPGEYEEILTSASNEAERLGNLVDNMLLLARIDAGQWPVHKGRVFLDDVLVDAAQSARVLGESKNVQIAVEPIDEVAVEGDPTLLRQLFMILLDNAIKFTPEGGQVTLRAHRNGKKTHVTITDTGVGIPSSALPHVFERFFRADPARSRGGAGLGLSIARWIVDTHHGRINVESVEGKGTVVKVSLPAA